jgi:uncharacterized protein (UPF0210 family)
MTIDLNLSTHERMQLVCQADGLDLIRIRSKKSWHLQCPKCKLTWSETLIRSGKAKGLAVKMENFNGQP